MSRFSLLRAFLACILGVLIGAAGANGTVFYVDADAPAEGDGSSWSEAFNYLQDAISEASSEDTIRVAQATYYPDQDESNPSGTGSRSATFQIPSGVAVYGGYAGYGEADPDDRDPDTYVTILSGDLNEDDGATDFDDMTENSYHVATVDGEVNATITLDGFTIQGGNAQDYPFDPNHLNDAEWRGGGLRVAYYYGQSPADLAVSQCTFHHNTGYQGAGAYVGSGIAPTFDHCTFSGNYISFDNYSPYGAGMYCGNYIYLEDCLFEDNEAVSGGGLYLGGSTSGAQVIHCTFTENWGRSTGGGVQVNDSARDLATVENPPLFDHCTFQGNNAEVNGAGASLYRAVTMTDCTFTDNEERTPAGSLYGGGVSVAGNSWFVDCTFDGNHADWGGAVSTGIGGITGTKDTRLLTANPDAACAAPEVAAGSRYHWDPVFMNCDFTDANDDDRVNEASGGGAMLILGEAYPLIVGCTFEENQADTGGALLIVTGEPNMINCSFVDNDATSYFGGAIDNVTAPDTLVTNCLFMDNTATDGGAISNRTREGPAFIDEETKLTLVNCTIHDNVAVDDGGGVFNQKCEDDSSAEFVAANCIFWDNEDDGGTDESAQIYNDSGSLDVTYSCVDDDDPDDENVFSGTGNIDDLPKFIDETDEDEDLRLRANSPCIDAGDTSAVPDDVADLDDDSNTDEPIPYDLAGWDRLVDFGVDDSGNCPSNPCVDMGAYEVPECICGDYDGNNQVNATDWSTFQVCYGLSAPTPQCDYYEYICSDLDTDSGRIDLTDFSTFQVIYGKTPDGISPPNCNEVD